MNKKNKTTKAKAAPAFRLAIPQAIREHEWLQRILTEATEGIATEQTAGRIMNINTARGYAIVKGQFDPQSFNDEMVGVALVELLKNPSTPSSLGFVVCMVLESIARSTGEWGWAKATDAEDIDKWLPSALEAIREAPTLDPKIDSLAPKANEPVMIEGMDVDTLAKAINVLQRILPDKAALEFDRALDAAQEGLAEADSSCNPELLKVWLPKLLEQEGGKR